MKNLFIGLMLFPLVMLNASASGCDGDASDLDLISSMDFHAEGELKCIKGDVCMFKLSNGLNASGIVLVGNELSKKTMSAGYYRYDSKKLLGQIKKYQEYGSCLNDAEVLKIEVMIEGKLYSAQMASGYP